MGELRNAKKAYAGYTAGGAEDAKEASGLKDARMNAATKGITGAVNITGAATSGFFNAAELNTGIVDAANTLINALNSILANNTSTTGLMNLWNNLRLGAPVTWKSIRGNGLLGAGKVLGAMESGAAAGGAAGPYGMAAGAAIGLGTGLAGWFTGKKKAKRLARDTNANMAAANLYAIASLNLNAGNMLLTNIDDFNRNWAAYGGPLSDGAIGYLFMTDYLANGRLKAENLNNNIGLETMNLNALGGTLLSNGANYTTGLTHVDAGGLHENSPYEGVPMGTDNEGTPNLVELGESIYKDYVFSDRLKVPKIPKNKKDLTWEEKVLKKYLGITYSDAAKKAEKNIYGEGGNLNGKLSIQYTDQEDKQKSLEAILAVLAESQELLKEEERRKEILKMIANMTPEELQMLLQRMAEALLLQVAQELQLLAAMLELAMQEQLLQLMPQEEIMQLQTSPEELMAIQLLLAMQEWMPLLDLMAYGGDLNDKNSFASGGTVEKRGNLSKRYITIDGKKYWYDKEVGEFVDENRNVVSHDVQNRIYNYLDRFDYSGFDKRKRPIMNRYATNYEILDVLDNDDWSRAAKKLKSYYKKKGINVDSLKGYAKQQYEEDIDKVALNPDLLKQDDNRELNITLNLDGNRKSTLKDFINNANNIGINRRYSKDNGYEEVFVNDKGNIKINTDSYLKNRSSFPAQNITFNGNDFIDSEGNIVDYNRLKTIDNFVNFTQLASPYTLEELAKLYQDAILSRYKKLGKVELSATLDDPNTRLKYLTLQEYNDWLSDLLLSKNPTDNYLANILRGNWINGKESPAYLRELAEAEGIKLGIDKLGNPFEESDEDFFNRVRDIDAEKYGKKPGLRTDNYAGLEHIPFIKAGLNNGKAYRLRLGEGEDATDIWLPYNQLESLGFKNVDSLTPSATKAYEGLGNIDIYDVPLQDLNYNVVRTGNPGSYRYFITNNIEGLEEIDPEQDNSLPKWETPEGYKGSIKYYELKDDNYTVPPKDDNTTKNEYPKSPWYDQLMGAIVPTAGLVATALSKANYSNANPIINYALNAPRIAPERVQEPLMPKLIDPLALANLIELLTATNRAALRNAGATSGLLAGNLIANNYKGLVAQSNALMAGILANNQLMLQWYLDDLRAQLANQQALLQADLANQNIYAQMASPLATGYGMRELIALGRANALTAGIQSIADSWYNQSRDRYTDKLLEWYLLRLGRNYRI